MSTTEARKALTRELVEHGHLVPTRTPGVFGHGGAFEEAADGLRKRVLIHAKDEGARRVLFPPLVPDETLKKTSYMESMPHLIGGIVSFNGGDKEHGELVARVQAGEPYHHLLEPTGLALAPAICYPLYPTCRGTLPADGRLFEMYGFAFRHEPSDDPARRQMFRMQELVRLHTPDSVRQWRTRWLELGQQILAELGLDVRAVTASDPFFGKRGRILKNNQREQELKFELVIPITSEEEPTAVASFNYHEDHFGKAFEIQTSDGQPAHTACLGFGIERVVLALFKTHGMIPPEWPASVRRALAL